MPVILDENVPRGTLNAHEPPTQTRNHTMSNAPEISPPTTVDTDLPVRGKPVTIGIHRDKFGDFHITTGDANGFTSGNFGPRPGNMLAGLFDYLYAIGAGNWSAVENETPR